MMFKLRKVILGIAMFALATSAYGGWWNEMFWADEHWPNCVGAGTCDDYYPKPTPCPRCVHSFVCPDYCPKGEPCPHCVHGFTCDDYCPKLMPRIHCPCAIPVCSPPCGPVVQP